LAGSEDRPRSARRDAASAHRVVDGQHRLYLLRQLVDNHALVTVRLDGNADAYNSAVLAVDREAGQVDLDELTPARGHQQVQLGTVLDVRARVGGVPLRFRGAVATVGHTDGIAFYRLPFPEEVDYRQQRAHFRAHVGRSQIIGVNLESATGTSIPGELHDVSTGGMAVRLSSGDRVILEGDGRFMTCYLEFPDGERMECRFEARHLKHLRSSGQVLGGQFVDLTPHDRTLLRRLVSEVQRDMLRKRIR
jgi:c-di-GMP-binding flagellar brake protein YcgR